MWTAASVTLCGLLLALLFACSPLPNPNPNPPPATCMSDSDCAGLTCSRLDTCEAPASLMTITVGWTVHGQPASAAACVGIDHLQVDYLRQGTDLGGFVPVSCPTGSLRFDRLPAGIDAVRINENDAADHLNLGSATGAVTGQPGAATGFVDLPTPL